MSIEIPRELADREGVPDDLDSSVVGPYRFPSTARRRTAGWVYVGAAVVAGLTAVTVLDAAMWWVAGGFLLFAGYHFASATTGEVDEQAALREAARHVPFSIGHASAALRFEGLLAQPVWNVLVYDADDPPTQRALVFIDAVTGEMRRDPYLDRVSAPTQEG